VDEVEKAHPHLRKFFLDEGSGTLTTRQDPVILRLDPLLHVEHRLLGAAVRTTPIGYRGDEEKVVFEVRRDRGPLRPFGRVHEPRPHPAVRAFRAPSRIFEINHDKVRQQFREIHGIKSG
jgi:hypothetical protein